jgi:subfamily B ATP-binding cassette protein MsbA
MKAVHWRLAAYVRRYVFPHVVILTLAMVVLSAVHGLIPFVIKHFINALTSLKDVRGLRVVAFEILGLFLVRAAANFVKDYLSAYVGQKIVVDLRSDLNNNLQRQSLSFFNHTPTGAIMSRVLNDVAVATNGITGGAFSVVADGGSLIAVVIAAFWLDWKLSLIAMVVFPCAVIPVTKFSKRMRRMAKKAQQQLSGLAVILQETFQGNRVVKAFGMEDYERRRFDRELKRLFRIYMRVAAIKAVTGPMIEAMGAFAVVGVIWWGIASITTGARTPGEFGAFFAAMFLVYEPFKRLAKTNNTIQQSLGAAERVFGMMDAPVEVSEVPEPLDIVHGPHTIRFENVSFRYGSDWVLRQIDLEIPAGKVVALVGMSGGGKSTLADLIPRFYDVADGRITIDSTDVRKLRLASLRAEIGIVTQHTFLFNDTVRANISYGSMGRGEEEIIAAARAANAHDFISRLPNGYDTVVGELGMMLSGGERQRIAIARALLKNAPILILDEATSSLDSEAERAVQDALDRLMANRTTLVIAHRLSTVRNADRIVVISHGRVVEQGTHEELFAMGREYRKLYDLQFLAGSEAGGERQMAG